MWPWRGPRESHFRRDLLLLLVLGPLSTVFFSERPGWRCSFWSSTSWCSSCFCFSWSTARGWKPRLWWGHFQGWVELLLLIIVDHVACWRLFLHSIIIFIIYLSLLLDDDHIDHHQVRALARAAGPSHVLGSRGKVRSPFFFRILKLEQLDDGIFFFPVNVVIYSHNHYPSKLLQIGVFSSHQHQGTEPPSLAQQSGLSTQSCQKTSTNDTKVREKLCDLSQYLSTYRPIPKRLWECKSSSQVWSGRGGIHPVFTNIEQHRAKVPFFAYSNEYLILNINIDNICIPAAILI